MWEAWPGYLLSQHVQRATLLTLLTSLASLASLTNTQTPWLQRLIPVGRATPCSAVSTAVFPLHHHHWDSPPLTTASHRWHGFIVTALTVPTTIILSQWLHGSPLLRLVYYATCLRHDTDNDTGMGRRASTLHALDEDYTLQSHDY